MSAASLSVVPFLRDKIIHLIKNNFEEYIYINLDTYIGYNKLAYPLKTSNLLLPNDQNRLTYENLCTNDEKIYFYTLLCTLAFNYSLKFLTKNSEETWRNLILNELKRVNCLIAMGAWLTVDGISLREDLKILNYLFPEDLHYNLVLEEPLAVITFSKFILNIDRDEVNEEDRLTALEETHSHLQLQKL
jgi:hypothetical protein